MAGRLKRDVSHGSRLAHDEHFHRLGYLPAREHRRIHHFPILKFTMRKRQRAGEIVCRMSSGANGENMHRI